MEVHNLHRICTVSYTHLETYNFSGGFRFYDAVVNDRALIERAYACGIDVYKRQKQGRIEGKGR